jgi:hypothetical protein
MNASGNTALLVAAINNVHEEILKLLLMPWEKSLKKERKKAENMNAQHS